MPPPAGARCSTHPTVAAVDVCQRCGRFVCGDCANVRNEDLYCSECTPRVDAKPPSTARWALAFALLPVPLLFGFRRLHVPLPGFVLAMLAFAVAAKLLSQSRDGKAAYWLTWGLQAVNVAWFVVQLLF